MQYLHRLMLLFPYFERVPDQDLIVGGQGERYDRIAATRGRDYLLIYDYTGRPFKADLTRIAGAKKRCWWYSPVDGSWSLLGTFASEIVEFIPKHPGLDCVLVAVEEGKDYVPGN
jgi:hypothetical protein